MSEVKTYAVNCNDAWLNTKGDDISDSYVKYADYQELAVQLANTESKCRELAAVNAGLKSVVAENWSLRDVLRQLIAGRPGGSYFIKWEPLIFKALNETPATDAFLAEVRASARNQGINYAASRLAAAFNHGFVDKSLAEVYDVVRMILDTKEELENSPLPAADGLSGEYADKFLTEFAGYSRKGVQS